MKYLLLLVGIFLLNDDINRIAFFNRIKQEAEQAYQAKNYGESAGKYQLLADSLGIRNEGILMNLAHSYFHLRDTGNASYYYNLLAESENKDLRSTAHQQLGILNSLSGKYDNALIDFKNALRANPLNDSARYNLELLKKLIRENPSQQENQKGDNSQNPDQDQKNQQDQQQGKQDEQNQQEQNQQQDQQSGDEKEKSEQEKQGKDSESEMNPDDKKDEQKLINQNPEEMKISEEKARMILEALRNREMQYIQQMKRKSSQKPDTGKPDW